MKLTTDQKQAVAEWVAGGATLNEIQDRLKNECGVVLTFMDTRFLLSDLGLTLQSPPDETEAEELPDGEAGLESMEEPLEGMPAAGQADDLADPAGAAVPGPVQVTVDAVTLPGTMVSGKVTFSDGVSGGWYLDQMGQLGLSGIPRSYQPPEADVVAFQRELQKVLR